MVLPDEVVQSVAPTGAIRAAINFGNPVLAQRDPASAEPRGVSVDLARELGRRTRLPVRFVSYDAAGKVFDDARSDAWDIAFLAADPARATDILFTAPYVLIEGGYVVRIDSPLQRVDDVDRPGVRVTVASKSAYDLFLTRTLRHAQIARAPTGEEAFALFLGEGCDVAAGVKGPLLRFAAEHADLRVLPGRFMVIEQAMGTPKGRDAAWRYLCAFVEDVKASGFVADALAASGRLDAQVAPPRRSLSSR
jgi:polar amino acid transport system substrate-binding protein